MKRMVKCHSCGIKVPVAAADKLVDRYYCYSCAYDINESFTNKRSSEGHRKTAMKRWHPSPEVLAERQRIYDRIERGECGLRGWQLW